MIELTITVSLTALVVGVVASLYSFVSVRLCDAYTQSLVIDQVNDVADKIEATIRNADSCRTLDAGAILSCSMPKNGVDSDGDGHYDAYYPDKVDAKGEGQYTVGRYYWFFQAGSDGAYQGATTGYIWRADSDSAAKPAKSDVDTDFIYYPGPAKKIRNNLVHMVQFAVDDATKTVTYTVTGGSRMGSENTDTSDLNASRVVSVTRTVAWRN